MSSGHVFGPADPPNSPLEKLLVPNKGRALWKLERDLMNSGLEVEVARNLVRAFKNYEVEREYEELKNYQELEYWANRHTHGGTVGGPAGTPQLISMMVSQQSVANIEDRSFDDGSILSNNALAKTLRMTQDSQGYFYATDLSSNVRKIDDGWGVQWTATITGHVNNPSSQAIWYVAASKDGIVGIANQYVVGVVDAAGTLLWLNDISVITTVDIGTGANVALSPTEAKVVFAGAKGLACFNSNDGTLLWEVAVTTDLDSKVVDIGFTSDGTGIIIGRRGSIQRRLSSDGSLDWSQSLAGSPADAYHPRPYGDNYWLYINVSPGPCKLISIDIETGLTLLSYDIPGINFDSFNNGLTRYGNLFIASANTAYLMGSHVSFDNQFFKIDLLTGSILWVVDPVDRQNLAVLHTLST